MFGPKSFAVVLSTLLLISACILPSSIPNLPQCPMGSPYEYLSCVFEDSEAEYDQEDIWMFSQATTRYCEENASDWISVLDSSAKKTALELKQYSLSKVREGELEFSEYKDLSDKEAFQATMVLYLAKPLLLGSMSNQPESCLSHFEKFESGGLIEWMRKIEEENK